MHIPAHFCLNLSAAAKVVLAHRLLSRQATGREPLLPLTEMQHEVREEVLTPAMDSVGWDGKYVSPVVKTTVTSLEARVFAQSKWLIQASRSLGFALISAHGSDVVQAPQVRILPRKVCPCSAGDRAPVIRCRLFPGL